MHGYLYYLAWLYFGQVPENYYFANYVLYVAYLPTHSIVFVYGVFVFSNSSEVERCVQVKGHHVWSDKELAA